MAEMIFATFSVIENSESANKNIWSLCKKPYVTVQKYVLLFKRPNKTSYFYYEKSPPPPRNVLQINYLHLTANRQILQNVLRIAPYRQS